MLAKLRQFQDAVDAAKEANSLKTWKDVCFACIDAGESPLAQICGLNVIVQVTLFLAYIFIYFFSTVILSPFLQFSIYRFSSHI
jgi:hypothetical protein